MANRRGSPEAIAKRRAGRAFNILLEAGASRRPLDGRSLKRRQRLLRELQTGKKGGSQLPLKPLGLLSRVNELLELGEPAATIRKAYRPRPLPPDEDALVRTVAELHSAYGFRPEAYRLVGISERVLRRSGVLPGRSEDPIA